MLALGPQRLTSGAGGGGLPLGYSYRVDELGAQRVDELADFRIGQDSIPYTRIREAVAARGAKFGAAVKLANLQNDSTYAALIADQADMLVFESNPFLPAYVEPSMGVYQFDQGDAAAAMAQSMGKPFRLHLLHYPAHDMTWCSTNNGTVISPVLDGGGQPVVNASNAEALMRNKVAAYAGRSYSQSVTSIDVSNELADPANSDGFRIHPWYTALGPSFLLILFNEARIRFPNTQLCLCQDQLEQTQSGFDIRGAFLKIIDYLQANNAPIDAVSLQGHLTFGRGWDAAGFRTFLQAIKSRGLKIKATEIDIRTGNTGTFIPANYTNLAYDQTAAVMIAQYLDVLLPYLDGGELLAWELSDITDTWGASERPSLYDRSYAVKPDYYKAFLETVAWSTKP